MNLDLAKWVMDEFTIAYGPKKVAEHVGSGEKFMHRLAEALAGFNKKRVLEAMEKAKNANKVWPPSLLEFLGMCEPTSGEYLHEAAALDYCMALAKGGYIDKQKHGDVYRYMLEKIGKNVLANEHKDNIWPRFLELYPRAIRWYESGGRIKEEEVKRLPGNVKRVEEFIKEMKEKVGI